MPAGDHAAQLLDIRLEQSHPDQRLEAATRKLRRDLESLGVAVSSPLEPDVPGSRGIDLAVIGALAVTLKPTIELLTEIVRLVNEWRGRDDKARTVRLRHGDREMVLEGAEDDDIARVIELFNEDQ